MADLVADSFRLLRTYCEQESFQGYDPYDGLNSILFQSFPFVRNSRFARLAWIQTFKRLPINLRPLVLIRKGYNPKGVGLFLLGYCNLYQISPDEEVLKKIHFLAGKLLDLRSTEWSGNCWGYNFDWQARAFFMPKNTPTVVATTFIASALLEAYKITKDSKLLDSILSSCNFVRIDLNRTYNEYDEFAFSYSPLDKSVVFNASLLGSRLLSSAYTITRDSSLLEDAKKSVSFCCRHQHEDGSWAYGTSDIHRWVDSFHTGYNLECISEYRNASGDDTFSDNLKKGLEYYLATFFTEEGISKYYSNHLYPVDVHAPAQLVITLSKLGKFTENRKLIDTVIHWTIRNMQSRKGYFYYQAHHYYSIHIPYMRWSQAWMFYALSEYMKNDSELKQQVR